MRGGVYYEVTGGEPLAFCRDFRARDIAKRREIFAHAESIGAKGWVGAYGYPNGFIFPDDKAPTGWTRSRYKTAEGRTYFRPNKRTEAGKAAMAAIDALGRAPNPCEFAERFGVPDTLRYRKSESNYGMETLNGVFPYPSFVAWLDAGDSFWVVLPDVDARVAAKVADGYTCEPTGYAPPEGLKRSSRARYDLSIAANAVAEEERGAA